MPFLQTPGVELYFETQGTQQKPALLLSNSLGTSLAMWEPQVGEFAENFFLVRYDARGHGRSSVPAGLYTIAQMGEDVLHLLDGLHLGRVHFCGLSLGGMVGQWLGAHAPERLHKLVLSNTAAKIGTYAGWNERISSVQRAGVGAVVESVLTRWYTDSFRAAHPEQVAKTESMLRANDAVGYVASCAAVRDMDQRETLHSIEAPTLVVAGTQDFVTPLAEAQELVSGIVEAKLLELNAAHLSNVEAASEFTSGVLAFLRAEGETDAR